MVTRTRAFATRDRWRTEGSAGQGRTVFYRRLGEELVGGLAERVVAEVATRKFDKQAGWRSEPLTQRGIGDALWRDSVSTMVLG